MMNKVLMTGSEAAALGAKLAKIEVLSYYLHYPRVSSNGKIK
jgi:pyruvate/2-oxoacid:ferredoxin oxidoreductase alpha subunit